MTDKKRHRRLVEWGKNLLIVLLILSALYLLGLTQFYSNRSAQSGGPLSSLWNAVVSDASTPTDAPEAVHTHGTVSPVRLAVCQQGQRYGVQYDTAGVTAAFSELSTLLSEALSSASAPTGSSEAVWQQALGQDGIYFDFLYPLPLECLAAWLEAGVGSHALSGSVSRICLAGEADDSVRLYYRNEEDGLYYTSRTTLSKKTHLDAALADWPANGTSFAFETPGMEALAPYTMLPAPLSMPAFLALNPMHTDPSRVDSLLSTLSFYSKGSDIDPTAGGQIVEGSDALRLSAAGNVSFHSIGDQDFRLLIPGTGLQSTLDYVWGLAESTAGAWCGDAQLRLSGVEAGGHQTVITFQYCLEGAPVTLSGGQPAARFVVRNGAVTDFSLYLRHYTRSEQTTGVLPELQAAAAMQALNAQGKDLLLSYRDNNTETVFTGWIAR